MKRWLLLVALSALLQVPVARADEGDSDADYRPKAPVRRSDFTLGTVGGILLGQADGYPTKVSHIGDPAYEANTGFAAGSGGGLWIGAALRDWFTFGVGGLGGGLKGQGLEASAGAFIVRLEGYPLFRLSGPWADFGFLAQFGAGGVSIKRGASTAAQGGSMSLVSVGVFHESLHLGRHFIVGPEAEFFHFFSPTLTSSAVLAGARLAFYGGP